MTIDANFIGSGEVATITLDSVDLGATFSAYTLTISSERSETKVQQQAAAVASSKTGVAAISNFDLAQMENRILAVVLDQASGNLASPTLTVNSTARGNVTFVATTANNTVGTGKHMVITAAQSVVQGDVTLTFDRFNDNVIGPIDVNHLGASNGDVLTIAETTDA